MIGGRMRRHWLVRKADLHLIDVSLKLTQINMSSHHVFIIIVRDKAIAFFWKQSLFLSHVCACRKLLRRLRIKKSFLKIEGKDAKV